MCFPLQRGFLNNGIISAKSSSEHDFLLGKIVADLKGQSEGKRETGGERGDRWEDIVGGRDKTGQGRHDKEGKKAMK